MCKEHMVPPNTLGWLANCCVCHKFCVEVSRALQLNRDSAQRHGAWVGGETLIGEVLLFASFHSSVFCLSVSFCFFLMSRLSFCLIFQLVLFFWTWWCACFLFAWVHLFIGVHWRQARHVSEKGLFSFPLRGWTDSGKRNLHERENKETGGCSSMPQDNVSLLPARVIAACFALILNLLAVCCGAHARFIWNISSLQSVFSH